MLVGWGVAVAAGRIAGHDGWLYYHGGDGTWYYTTAWVLGNGHIPAAVIGYGYPLLIAPIAGIAGSSLLDGIPAVVIFNQLVLAPIALVCIYGITRMFASRWYAYIVSLLWVLDAGPRHPLLPRQLPRAATSTSPRCPRRSG